MNTADIILIAGILLALGLAIRKCVKDRKKGTSCGGSCAQCSHRCGK